LLLRRNLGIIPGHCIVKFYPDGRRWSLLKSRDLGELIPLGLLIAFKDP